MHEQASIIINYFEIYIFICEPLCLSESHPVIMVNNGMRSWYVFRMSSTIF